MQSRTFRKAIQHQKAGGAVATTNNKAARVQRPPIPYPVLQGFLYSRRHRHVRFLPGRNQFWYQPDPANEPDQWKRVYGLTQMLFHVFWPDFDRQHVFIVATKQRLRKNYYASRRNQRKKLQTKKRAGRGGGRNCLRSTQQIKALSRAEPAEQHGARMGELVHKQLHVWATDRFTGKQAFGSDRRVEWPPNPRTMAIIRVLTRELGIDVRYGELMIYDPRIPVATSIDLVGWSRPRQRLVLIEIKTGAKWDRNVGCGPMHGQAAAGLQLNNAPWNQAIVQLATTTAIVEEQYHIPSNKLEGLLIWANRWLSPVGEGPIDGKEVQVDKVWLDTNTRRAGKRMLREMKAHMDRNSGRPWGKNSAFPKSRRGLPIHHFSAHTDPTSNT